MKSLGKLWGVFLVVGLFGLFGIIFVKCGGDSDKPAKFATRIHLMYAEDGTLTPVNQSMDRTRSPSNRSNEYTLTLENVSEDMLWYTDRPNQESGTESVGYFISAWFSSYGEVAPNAILDGYIGTNVLNDGLFLTLNEPQYDSNSKKLTFNVTLLHSSMEDKNPKTALNIEKIKITVLNNGDNQTWSSAQVAPDAYFEPTKTDGAYKLYLNNVHPDLYNLGNAPNRGVYTYQVRLFIQNWQALFGDDPPNGSMTSYLQNGDLKIHILTLDSPEYDENAKRVSYTARLLHGKIEDNQTLNSPTLFIDDAHQFLITVKNNLDEVLYVRGINHPDATKGEKVEELATDPGKKYKLLQPKGQVGDQYTFTVTPPWRSGNVYGCWKDPSSIDINEAYTMQKQCAMIEPTVLVIDNKLNLNCDITYVDAISLPAQMEAIEGSACNPSSGKVATTFSEDDVKNNCPTKLLNDNVCISAHHFCLDFGGETPLSGDVEFCSKFDHMIRKLGVVDCPGCCPDATDAKTSDVYGCAPPFFNKEKGKSYCAAMNRGLGCEDANEEGQKDPSKFYPKSGTYNTYADFVHDIAGAIYAFPYDDYPGNVAQSGDLGCQEASGLIISYGSP